jgi:hypothetical protein
MTQGRRRCPEAVSGRMDWAGYWAKQGGLRTGKFLSPFFLLLAFFFFSVFCFEIFLIEFNLFACLHLGVFQAFI